MSSAKIIKLKTKSVQNIQKMTDALEKIAVSKIPKFSSLVNRADLYYNSLYSSFSDIFSYYKLIDKSIYSPFLNYNNSNKVLFLCINSNRGLCGPYNSSIWSIAKGLSSKLSDYSIEYYVVGKKGIQSAKFNNLYLHKSCLDFNENSVYEYVDRLFLYISNLFLSKTYNSIYLIYNYYYPGIGQKAKYELLLPFNNIENTNEISNVKKNVDSNKLFVFEPNADIVIKNLFENLIKSRLFYVFLQSVLSENVARSVAMKQAYNSAKDIANTLIKKYNKIRQNKVTNEIIEIMGASSISN